MATGERDPQGEGVWGTPLYGMCHWTGYIENTSWKVLAYGIYARVVDVSEIERVSAANE